MSDMWFNFETTGALKSGHFQIFDVCELSDDMSWISRCHNQRQMRFTFRNEERVTRLRNWKLWRSRTHGYCKNLFRSGSFIIFGNIIEWRRNSLAMIQNRIFQAERQLTDLQVPVWLSPPSGEMCQRLVCHPTFHQSFQEHKSSIQTRIVPWPILVSQDESCFEDLLDISRISQHDRMYACRGVCSSRRWGTQNLQWAWFSFSLLLLFSQPHHCDSCNTFARSCISSRFSRNKNRR